jgi:hypothetical protein
VTRIYDAGVLVAADRNDRTVWADHRAQLEMSLLPVVTAPVVAQASRSPRQGSLHRFMRGCHTVPFTVDEATAVGTLLARAGTSDVVDAHVAVTAARLGGTIVTGDADDMRVLVAAVEQPVIVVPLG